MDEDTYRKARIKAAERDTSVSALVKQFLIDITRSEAETDLERLKHEEARLIASIKDFNPSDRLSRDAVHLRLAQGSFANWSDPEAERAFRDF